MQSLIFVVENSFLKSNKFWMDTTIISSGFWQPFFRLASTRPLELIETESNRSESLTSQIRCVLEIVVQILDATN